MVMQVLGDVPTVKCRISGVCPTDPAAQEVPNPTTKHNKIL
jgi:hypothetical protein